MALDAGFGKLLKSNAAGVAKLAYATDSKSEICFFCPLRNSSNPLDVVEENNLDALKPFAGIFEHFDAF